LPFFGSLKEMCSQLRLSAKAEKTEEALDRIIAAFQNNTMKSASKADKLTLINGESFFLLFLCSRFYVLLTIFFLSFCLACKQGAAHFFAIPATWRMLSRLLTRAAASRGLTSRSTSSRCPTASKLTTICFKRSTAALSHSPSCGTATSFTAGDSLPQAACKTLSWPGAPAQTAAWFFAMPSTRPSCASDGTFAWGCWTPA
jgi:hypothetical protein